MVGKIKNLWKSKLYRLCRETLVSLKSTKTDILCGIVVFVIVVAIFFPLISFGGFHHTDDFHFFRSYSPKELFEVWYSNYNLLGRESDGYRPLIIWTNHFLYTILGFNDKFFMLVIVILNGLYALLAYRFARNFLNRSYGVIAGLLAILLPQTLFKFTFATAIYSTILFGLMLFGYDSLLRWYKGQNKKYLSTAIIAGILASLYKENGYCLLLSVPLVVIAGTWHDKSKKLRKIILNFYVWLPLLLLGGLLVIRHYALLVYPERLNPNSPSLEIQFNIPFLLNMFHSVELEIVAILRPIYETFFKNFFQYYYLDSFILVAIPFVIICFLANWRIWRSRIVSVTCICESIALAIYLGLKFSFLFSFILKFVPGYEYLFRAYYFLFYVLLAVIVRELWIRKDNTPVFLLFIFLVISVLPSTFAPLNRLRIVSNAFSLVLVMAAFQFIQRSVFNNKVWVKTVIMTFFGVVVFLFGVRTIQFVLVDNFKYSEKHLKTYRDIVYSKFWSEHSNKYSLNTQIKYAKAMLQQAKDIGYIDFIEDGKMVILKGRSSELHSGIINASFEQGLEGWNGPGDCSSSWPGEPVFTADFSDDATDGTKSLLLGSENHIAGINTRIRCLKKGEHYRLSFDAKKLTGISGPEIYLSPAVRITSWLQILPLSNGWKRYYIPFIAKDENILLTLYCKSQGEKNAILYDNLRLSRMEKTNLSALIVNASFEQGLEGWNGPGDCSSSWPGEPVFTADFSDDATDGTKSLLLGSENHIAGINTRIRCLKKGEHYRLSFDAKRLAGTQEPAVDLNPTVKVATRYRILPLSYGWKRYRVCFIPKDENILLTLYCKSQGEKNAILYDNLRLEKVNLFTFLPSWPIFESPWH